MAAHFSVLAWRIPGTGEPGGLPSMGSHKVGHDWSDLAVAAAYTYIYFKHFLPVCNLSFHSLNSVFHTAAFVHIYKVKLLNFFFLLWDLNCLLKHQGSQGGHTLPAISLGPKNSHRPMFPKAGIQAEVLALRTSLGGVKKSRGKCQRGGGRLIGWLLCFKNRFKFFKNLKIFWPHHSACGILVP